MTTEIRLIEKGSILDILPLLQKINDKTPLPILKERIIEMAKCTNYECVGLYANKNLVGITGLWYSTRHYIGKSVETDHVVIDEKFRGQNLGKLLFSWIEDYTKSKGYEAIELNTYTGNTKSHKFYYNEGFDIYGFHFLKVTRNDKVFY